MEDEWSEWSKECFDKQAEKLNDNFSLLMRRQALVLMLNDTPIFIDENLREERKRLKEEIDLIDQEINKIFSENDKPDDKPNV